MSAPHYSDAPAARERPQAKPEEAPSSKSRPGGGHRTVTPTGNPDELAPADDGPHPEQPPLSEPQPAKVPPGGGTKRGM